VGKTRLRRLGEKESTKEIAGGAIHSRQRARRGFEALLTASGLNPHSAILPTVIGVRRCAAFAVCLQERASRRPRVHDRMPVIIAPKNYELWLDVAVQEPERLQPLLRPNPDAEMEAYPVSMLVNSPKNNSPECVEPIG
jgi:putative SOS response-associated peptidase YedK